MKNKNITKIRDFLLYGGKSKNEYANAKYLIRKSNHKLWKIISFIATFVFLFLALYCHFLIAKNHLEMSSPEGLKMVSYLIMSGISFIVAILLNFVIKVESILDIVLMYVLVFLIIGYGIFISNLDPLVPGVTIMVMIIITPLSIVDRPWKIILMVLVSITAEIITATIVKDGTIRSNDIINSIVFGAVAIIIDTYIQYVRIKGYVNERILRRQAYVDSLTGLGNELSYIEQREYLDKKIKNQEDIEFAIVMLDVNNVKLTNDTYGHIYGCSMIVETGHYLRRIFGSSKLYHIGGDEFLAIVLKEDLKSLGDIISRFDSDMENYMIKKNDIELRLTVARGYTLYNKELDKGFSDVLARADAYMYENKREMKIKYNLPSR